MVMITSQHECQKYVILYRRLVPAKFVYVLVRMRYFLAVKYKHKLRGESSSAERKQQAMSDTSCAVGCQNRIEILSKLS